VEEIFMGHQHKSQTKNTIASPQSQTNAIARSSTHPIEELQGAIGNRAVNKLLANQPTLQAKPMFGGLSRELVIQPKLTIGAVGDKYEQEADRVASQVVKQIEAPATDQSTQGESVQRQEELEEENIQAKLILQRREGSAGGEGSTDLASAINNARGSGKPLDADLQRSIGQAMGADFSGVRVHTDAKSDELNQSIQAKAFTTKQDVFFRQGVYQPRSRRGQELIAHELTHVVQQNGGTVQRSPLLPKQDVYPVEVRLRKEGAGIQKMPMEKFEEVIAKNYVNEFMQWFAQEFKVWQNTGAFSGDVLGFNAAGDKVYKEMYSGFQNYIEDAGFKDLAYHIGDYKMNAGYVNVQDTRHTNNPEYQRYLDFDNKVVKKPPESPDADLMGTKAMPAQRPLTHRPLKNINIQLWTTENEIEAQKKLSKIDNTVISVPVASVFNQQAWMGIQEKGMTRNIPTKYGGGRLQGILADKVIEKAAKIAQGQQKVDPPPVAFSTNTALEADPEQGELILLDSHHTKNAAILLSGAERMNVIHIAKPNIRGNETDEQVAKSRQVITDNMKKAALYNAVEGNAAYNEAVSEIEALRAKTSRK
jgi:Domain of unknown function (DUF4157)